jgi:hypothetical protein
MRNLYSALVEGNTILKTLLYMGGGADNIEMALKNYGVMVYTGPIFFKIWSNCRLLCI